MNAGGFIVSWVFVALSIWIALAHLVPEQGLDMRLKYTAKDAVPIEEAVLIAKGFRKRFKVWLQRQLTESAIHGLGQCLLAFLIALYLQSLLHITGVSLAGALIGWLLPKRMKQVYWYQQEIRLLRELPQMFGVLSGWAAIENQLTYCIEKMTEAGLSKALIGPYKQWLVEVNSGVSTERALSRLEQTVILDFQKHFVRCLVVVNVRQGQLSELFTCFEDEASQMLHEIQKTSLMRLQYSVLIAGLWLSALCILYFLIVANPMLSGFYLNNTFGQSILTGLCFVGAIGFAVGLDFERYHTW